MIYGYTRVSTEEQAEGTSLATQAVAIAQRYKIDAWLEDAGVSGTVYLFDRPSMQEVELRPGDLIVCYDPSRFSRDHYNGERALHELTNLDVQVTSIQLGDMNKTNACQRGASRVMSVVADIYREELLEKTKIGRRAKRERGGFIGGEAPWGCRVEGKGKESKVVELPFRREAIGMMRVLRDEGKSYRDIAQLVTAKYKLPTSHMKVKRTLDAQSTAP
jgi:site-specific DNA recombinase